MLKILNIFDFNFDLYKNNHIFLMFFKKFVYFLICMYHISYPIIFKISVSACQIRVISHTHIVYVKYWRNFL